MVNTLPGIRVARIPLNRRWILLKPRCASLTLRRNMPDSCRAGSWPVENMKKMRYLFLVLAFCFGLCAQRAPGQTVHQNLTSSIIFQYVTNYVNVTNTTTKVVNSYEQLDTVLINTANVAKAIALQKFTTNWAQWSPADIFYEVNLNTGNQGIYLARSGIQTNVSDFFGNSFTNLFSQNVNTVFSGTNFAASLPLGGDKNDNTATMITNITQFANLAYMTFSATNTNTVNNNTNLAFDLFGYSQGQVVLAGGYLDGKLYQMYLPEGEIVGAGTFTLNLTTNVFGVIINNYTNTFGVVTTNYGNSQTNYTGVAHGTVYIGPPVYSSTLGTNGP
jgi:hypothetical protein